MVCVVHSELEFDNSQVRKFWGGSLFERVPKENHFIIQRRVISTLQDLHKLNRGCFVTSIHNLGLGHYILIESFTTIMAPLRYVISEIHRFGPKSNQELAGFVEHRQSDLLADLSRVKKGGLRNVQSRSEFLTGVLQVCGKGLLNCKANSQMSKRLVEAVENGAERIISGASSQHHEIHRISNSLMRLKRMSA